MNSKRHFEKIDLSFLKITLFSTVFLLIGTFLFKSWFSSSYAIPTGVDRSGFPSSSFHTNMTSTGTTNYLKNALGSQTSSISDNFNVPANYMNDSNSAPLYKLMKNLDTATINETLGITDDSPVNISDKGILYILAHGYNTTNTTNTVFSTGTYGAVTNNSIKQYVTQIALWLYIYEHKANFSETYCANQACNFTENGSTTLVESSAIRNLINTASSATNYQYLKYITLLVDNANSYTGGQTSGLASFTSGNIQYQINDNYSLLVTDTLTPTASSNQSNYMYYSVEIEDPNSYGVYITDTEGNRIDNTDIMNGSFKVAVPLSSNLSSMNLRTVEIKVYGHFVKDEGRAYLVTDSPDSLVTSDKTQKFSDILFGYTPKEVVGTSFTLHNFVKISKIDITDSSELPGAILEITNKNDTTKKETWTSTSVPHYTYLENGEYTLCENTAPLGYDRNEECIDFTVTDDGIVTVTMENSPTPIEPPDTGLFASRSLYGIGLSLMLIGCGWMFVVLMKNKKQAN